MSYTRQPHGIMVIIDGNIPVKLVPASKYPLAQLRWMALKHLARARINDLKYRTLRRFASILLSYKKNGKR